MTRRSSRQFLLIAALAGFGPILLGGCPGTVQPTPTPTLTVTSVKPLEACAGDPDTTIVIDGTDFTINAMVVGDSFQGSLNITNTTSAELKATIPSALLAKPGTIKFHVTASGRNSNIITFVVKDCGLPPTITAVSPTFVDDGKDTAATLTGTNFGAGTIFTVGGTDRAATGVNSTTAMVIVKAADKAGVTSVTFGASNGGGPPAQFSAPVVPVLDVNSPIVLPHACLNQAYSSPIFTITGGTHFSGVFEYQATIDGLPAGLQRQLTPPFTNTFNIAGTPTVKGTFNITVTVKDLGNPQQMVTLPYTLVVDDCTATCSSANFVGNTYVGRINGAAAGGAAEGLLAAKVSTATGGSAEAYIATLFINQLHSSPVVDYTFNSDCTGIFNDPQMGAFAMQVSADGNQIWLLQKTDATGLAARLQADLVKQDPAAVNLTSLNGSRLVQMSGTAQLGSSTTFVPFTYLNRPTLVPVAVAGPAAVNLGGWTYANNDTVTLGSLDASGLVGSTDSVGSLVFPPNQYPGVISLFGNILIQSANEAIIVEGVNSQQLVRGQIVPAGTTLTSGFYNLSVTGATTGLSLAGIVILLNQNLDFTNKTATGTAIYNDPAAGLQLGVAADGTITVDPADTGLFTIDFPSAPAGLSQLKGHADNQSPPNIQFIEVGQTNTAGAAAAQVLSGEGLPQSASPFTLAAFAGNYIVRTQDDPNTAGSTTFILAVLNVAVDGTISGPASLNAPTGVTTSSITGNISILNAATGEAKMTLIGLSAAPKDFFGFMSHAVAAHPGKLKFTPDGRQGLEVIPAH